MAATRTRLGAFAVGNRTLELWHCEHATAVEHYELVVFSGLMSIMFPLDQHSASELMRMLGGQGRPSWAALVRGGRP